ncbi:type II toxin-antitoxin system VapB family antitoxin [Planctomycetota bacterium]
MRTTLNIPEDLLREAQRLAQTSSKTATVIYSLQELIRIKRLEELRRLRGKLQLEIDLELLRRPRHG